MPRKIIPEHGDRCAFCRELRKKKVSWSEDIWKGMKGIGMVE